jgi:hypothetical protein
METESSSRDAEAERGSATWLLIVHWLVTPLAAYVP